MEERVRGLGCNGGGRMEQIAMSRERKPIKITDLGLIVLNNYFII
jgi:hypothetical protein